MLNSNHKPQMISADLAQAIYYAAFEWLGSFELGGLLKKTDPKVVQLRDNGCNRMSSAKVKDLLDSINKQYGLPSSQGFYLRIGRVTFQYLRGNSPQMIIANSIEKRMHLLEDQIGSELEKDANWLQKNLDYQLDVKKKKGYWMIIANHPEEHSPEINNAVFFFFKGFLQECLEWMDNRHRYVISLLSDPVHNNSFSIPINSQSLD